MRRYKDKLFHLERWSEEAGCLGLGSSAKEVWVRVVGIRLHCWSGGKFKKIGDCCEGLLEVDEETKSPVVVGGAAVGFCSGVDE
ncbi:hypothetical protein CK203_113715 [Vitis vinifera]|uniref:Uncharacterized protein n=1 Tax=Vitis vinifera TaxID=29760 RepID=A0A438CXJ5_VITVI|nr:hypothetical protein CK203_113715 [Vitis vinifera]